MPPAMSLLRHELRTPLCAVHGYLETVLSEDLSPQKTRKFLEIALTEARRISALLDDLAQAAPRSSASIADVAACIREAMESLQPQAERAAVFVHAIDAPGIGAAIPSHRLTQMLADLIDNAIRYGARPGRIEIWSARYGERVFIAVDDDGPGIEDEARARIFEAGLRLKPAGAPGSGLGLAFVAWAASAAGGRAVAERSPLGGARVLLELRAA
jgi:two-component system sensor histidine kinase PrrB